MVPITIFLSESLDFGRLVAVLVNMSILLVPVRNIGRLDAVRDTIGQFWLYQIWFATFCLAQVGRG